MTPGEICCFENCAAELSILQIRMREIAAQARFQSHAVCPAEIHTAKIKCREVRAELGDPVHCQYSLANSPNKTQFGYVVQPRILSDFGV